MTDLTALHQWEPMLEPDACQPQKPVRILIVDDDAAIAELNRRILSRFEYIVGTAFDGEDAWSQLQNNTYDLMITDQRMPHMTGLELIARMRNSGMSLPVILASGMISVADLNRCYGLKIKAFLNKPYTVQELIQAVGDALDSQRHVSAMR